MKDKQIVYLKIKEIKKSRTPLRLNLYGNELKRLAASIKACGILKPLIVRINENSEYEIISGNRRLDAAALAGLSRVPCIIKRKDNLSSLVLAICENTTSLNLNFFEEAEALYLLQSKYKLSINAAAEKVGLSPSAFKFKTALLNLSSPIRQRIESVSLSEEYARLLLKLPENARENAIEKIIAESLTLSDAEKLINKLLSPPKTKFTKMVIGDVRLFSNSLNKMVDTMKLSGINAVSEQNETKESIEYKVIIPK